jgi:pyruvate/2-oxoglutarate dehydrogenase complex dihydrolipoamide dehydrogenase (E3) component
MTLAATFLPDQFLAGVIAMIEPRDAFNQALVDNVHPPTWTDREPAPRYNLVVLGAGTAGLVTAAGAAGLGAKVALVERDYLGGDCLNFGCVPSKAVLRAGRAVADVRNAAQFGVRVEGSVIADFAALMERMRRLRAEISVSDSAQRFRGLGVDVFLGAGRFTSPQSVEVNGKTLRFQRAVIATGARAARPAIPGLAEAGFFTNETIFNLTELPRRLAVIGAGPVGCELAQAFARFGAEVTMLVRSRILPREDPAAAALVELALRRDSVRLQFGAKLSRVEQQAGDKVLHLDGGELRCDAILVATGRAPNVENLGLEAAGVVYDNKGVTVNDRLRTSNPRVFAAGDIGSRYQFTHAADAQARLVIQNALFHGRARASSLVMPWCTYTDPEVAHVGLYEHEAAQKKIAIDTFIQDMAHVDRAILDGETEGFVKVVVRKGTDRLLGATIVARHAGEMISEATLAITSSLGLSELSATIHPYPTQAEALRKVGDAYNRTRLTPTVKWLFDKWLSWSRR